MSVTATVSTTSCVPAVKVAAPGPPGWVFCPTCCAAAASIQKKNAPIADRICQNLRRRVVPTLRIALAAAGNPNCALFTVVFHAV